MAGRKSRAYDPPQNKADDELASLDKAFARVEELRKSREAANTPATFSDDDLGVQGNGAKTSSFDV